MRHKYRQRDHQPVRSKVPEGYLTCTVGDDCRGNRKCIEELACEVLLTPLHEWVVSEGAKTHAQRIRYYLEEHLD